MTADEIQHEPVRVVEEAAYARLDIHVTEYESEESYRRDYPHERPVGRAECTPKGDCARVQTSRHR
jgi:hypothetical protein